MEEVLKWNKGFYTPTKAGTLALPRGIAFFLKALENGKGKTLSTIKNVSQISYISIKSI